MSSGDTRRRVLSPRRNDDSDGSSSPSPGTPTLRPSAPPSPVFHHTPTHLAPIAPSSMGRRSSSPPASAISTLALPQPVSPIPHLLHRPTALSAPRKSLSARIAITPLDRPTATPNIVETLPRSTRDLKSLGDSTARPPLDPASLGLGVPSTAHGSTTVKARSIDVHVRDYQDIIDRLRISNAEEPDDRGASPGGSQTAVLEEGAVDELEVEWCWFCHDEFSRLHMALKALQDDGQQWVCASCDGKGDAGRRGLAGRKEPGTAEISMVRGNLSAS